MTIPHGTILGGLSTVPSLADGLRAYRDVLGLNQVEKAALPADLAESWGCPANAGSPFAVLQPKSGEPCFFRLVEQASHPAFKPTTTYGWAAFELTVEDVWHWPQALSRELFTVVGPPKELEMENAPFIPMQTLGPGREMIYLNQVLGNMPDSDLPKAQSAVDKMFICILATPDREATLGWYGENLALDRGSDFTLPYSMINDAFGLPSNHMTTISMVNGGRMPIVEVDDYPDSATPRARHEGMLPPGNALITLAMRDLDACKVDWIVPPEARDGAMYEGRRAGTTIGPAGELLELVEVG